MRITLSSILITTFTCVGFVSQVSLAQDSGKPLFVTSKPVIQSGTILISDFLWAHSPYKQFMGQSLSSIPLRMTQKSVLKGGVATVSIYPATITVDPLGTGSFQVVIESGVTPVGAFDFDISWTAGILTINSVNAGSPTEFGKPIANINNTSGKLTITGFQYSSLSQPVGKFSVAVINYSAGQSGSTSIDLTVQELSDTNGVVFTTTAVDGSFSVGSGDQPTPTPTLTSTQSASPTATATETSVPDNTPTPSPTIKQATPTSTPKPVPTALNPEADLDGDGKVGPGDLLLLMNDWGRPIGTN